MEDTKRYAVFAGENYYPSGGWRDFQGFHTTLESAQKAVKELSNTREDWFQIVAIYNGAVVVEGNIEKVKK